MNARDRWNEKIDPYRVGSIGIRHLPKAILYSFTGKRKLIVLAFHTEPKLLVVTLARMLKNLGFELSPLYEALKKIGII